MTCFTIISHTVFRIPQINHIPSTQNHKQLVANMLDNMVLYSPFTAESLLDQLFMLLIHRQTSVRLTTAMNPTAQVPQTQHVPGQTYLPKTGPHSMFPILAYGVLTYAAYKAENSELFLFSSSSSSSIQNSAPSSVDFNF